MLIVTLPEATPVQSAAALERDLRRAEIEPYAWIINQSLAPLSVSDPVLRGRQQYETHYIREVMGEHARRVAHIGWRTEPPVGRAALLELISESVSARKVAVAP